MSLTPPGTVAEPVAEQATTATHSVAVAATSPRWLRPLFGCTWPIALAVWIYAVAGRVGFNPSDEGLTASYTYRILDGQVPHRDFISPRPLGSAYLHVIDFLLPIPLYDVARMISIAEILAFSLLFATLLFGRPPWRWGVLESVGAAASVLVNLHGFPLLAWYTIDGLLLVAIGCNVLAQAARRGEGRWRVYLGIAILGAAVITKQSFLPAAVGGTFFGVLLLRRWGSTRLITDLARCALVAATPLLAYGLYVTAAGGWAEMMTQLTSPKVVYGEDLLDELMSGDAGPAVLVVLLLGVLHLLSRVGDRDPPSRPLSLARELAQATALVMIGYVVLWVTVRQDLFYLGSWPTRLTQLLVVVVILRAVLRRSPDGVGVLILAVAWMTSLSWGAPHPGLVAGSVGLGVIALGGRDVFRLRPQTRAITALLVAAALAGAWTIAVEFRDQRRNSSYHDLAANRQPFAVKEIDSEFGHLRTNRNTARYLTELKTCVRRYPAKWVAIVPDNAGLYGPLGLDNPFPIDWFYPGDYAGSEERLIEAARDLDAAGDYLVLFQTLSTFTLIDWPVLPAAHSRSTPFMYDAEFQAQFLAELHGTRIECGTFVGFYAPEPLP